MKFVRAINHVTLAVSDLDRSLSFYTNALGLILIKQWEGGAYLTAGEHWLCLSLDSHARASPHPDYTHMAFDVAAEDFEDIRQQCLTHDGTEWKKNTSEGDSFYFLDPDGHKLEIHVGTLETRLKAMNA